MVGNPGESTIVNGMKESGNQFTCADTPDGDA